MSDALPGEGKGPIERVEEIGVNAGGRIDKVAEEGLQSWKLGVRRKANDRKTKVRRRRGKRALGRNREVVVSHGEEGRKSSNHHPEGWQLRAKGRRKRHRQVGNGKGQTSRRQVCQRHTN